MDMLKLLYVIDPKNSAEILFEMFYVLTNMF